MDATKLLTGPQTDSAQDTDTNVATQATIAAPGAGYRWIVTSIWISADRAPTAPLVFTLSNNATIVRQYEISANAFSPMEINFAGGIRMDSNVSTTVDCNAGGTSVKITIGVAAKKV